VEGSGTMEKSQDIAARRIEKQVKSRCAPDKSPDATGKGGDVEVESTIEEIPPALLQFAGAFWNCLCLRYQSEELPKDPKRL